jgi:hypothetical protein
MHSFFKKIIRNPACLILVFIFQSYSAICQDKRPDYIKRIPLDKCYSADVPPPDTFPEMKNNYLELIYGKTEFLLQARSFKNTDSSITVFVAGMHSDQQCTFYHTYCFEYSQKTDSVKEIPVNTVLPQLHVNLFLKNSQAPKVILKYLKEIKKEYLGDNATLDDALNEFYDVRYIVSSKNEILTATLNVCDYITTVVSIKKADQKIIEIDFKKLYVRYDNRKKKFILK